MSDKGIYNHYSLIMEWDPVDSIYVVTVPELAGCITHGATIEEAARQARDAIESWVDAALEDGEPVPSPKYFDIDSSSYIEHKKLKRFSVEKAG